MMSLKPHCAEQCSISVPIRPLPNPQFPSHPAISRRSRPSHSSPGPVWLRSVPALVQSTQTRAPGVAFSWYKCFLGPFGVFSQFFYSFKTLNPLPTINNWDGLQKTQDSWFLGKSELAATSDLHPHTRPSVWEERRLPLLKGTCRLQQTVLSGDFGLLPSEATAGSHSPSSFGSGFLTSDFVRSLMPTPWPL